MKKSILQIIIVVAVLAIMSAGSQIRISQIIGDTTGAPTLKQELKNRPVKDSINSWLAAKSDASDTISATDLFYTKPQIETLVETSSIPVYVKDANYFGMDIKMWPAFSFALQRTTGAMANNRMYVGIAYLKNDTTLNGFYYDLAVVGDFTANSNYCGITIYSYNPAGPDVANVVAYTASDSDMLKGTQGMRYKAFTSPVSLNAGTYYLGIAYNRASAVTEPSIGFCGTTFIGTKILYGKSFVLNGWVTCNSTTPPATFTPSTISANSGYIPTLLGK